MSRTSKGPRLCKRAARRKNGAIIKRGVWVIRDGSKEISTGCFAGPTDTKAPKEAEQALADYLLDKNAVARRVRDIAGIPITDVLSIYLDDKDPDEEDVELEQLLDRLSVYWRTMTLADVNTKTCQGYVKHREDNGGGKGGARRDLEIFRAAVNHHSHENLHYGKVNVWLPQRGEPRDRWLTRSEAAAMVWKAYRYREVQTIQVGPRKGQKIRTNRRPLRHVARFLLIGCYTGTRAGAIASASKRRAFGKSYVDLEHGVFYRKPVGKRASKKRQPPVPLPRRLLAHLRRWARLGIAKEHFVEWNGKPIASINDAFRRVVELADIDTSIGKVTPHTLRHTAATWLMQQGVNMWTAAGYLGMSVEVLERVYGHHHSAHLKEAVEGITAKKNTSGNEWSE
jgi:integrase